MKILENASIQTAMRVPLATPDQLVQHIKSLRRARGLTQTDLGRRIGVKQARVAEIEANPGAVSVEQMFRILYALGARIELDFDMLPADAYTSSSKSRQADVLSVAEQATTYGAVTDTPRKGGPAKKTGW